MNRWIYRWRGQLLAALFLALCVSPSASDNTVAFLALLAPAFALRVWARSCIGEHTRGMCWDAPGLMTSGPYARMRHPLYVSNGFAGFAFAGFHLGTGMPLMGFDFLLTLFLAVLMRSEDHWLEARYTDIWRAWAMRVPAVGWGRGVKACQYAPLWNALRGDTWTWISWGVVFLALVVRKGWLRV